MFIWFIIRIYNICNFIKNNVLKCVIVMPNYSLDGNRKTRSEGSYLFSLFVILYAHTSNFVHEVTVNM
ncbi:hypothetical protein ACJX0J_019479, partial [Zea mays]